MMRNFVCAAMAALAFSIPSQAWEAVELEPAAAILSTEGRILCNKAEWPVYWYLSGLMKKSADNGATWSDVPWADMCGIYTARLLGPSGIILAGDSALMGGKPFLSMSADGGASWKTQSLGPTWGRVGNFIDWDGKLMMAGFDSTNRSDMMGMKPRKMIVSRSLDSGKVWTNVLTLDSVAAVDPLFYPIGGDSFLLVFARGTPFRPTYETYKSEDGGQNWAKQADLTMHPAGALTVKMVSPDFFYAAAMEAWKKSVDGGKTWVTDSAFYTNEGELLLSDMAFSDAKHGVAVSWMGVIMTTVDGGESWTVDSLSRKTLLKDGQTPKAVFAVDSAHFWITGGKGLLWKGGVASTGVVKRTVYKSTAEPTLRIVGNSLRIDKQFIGSALTVVGPNGNVVRRISAAQERISLSSLSLPTGFYILSVEKSGKQIGTFLRF